MKYNHVFVVAPIKQGCDGCCYDVYDKPCQYPGRPECYGRKDGKSGIYKVKK
jgi:hypothetical protein